MDRTPAGESLYHHRGRREKPAEAFGESDNIELISCHIERHIGPIDMVYHELASDLVHIDVHMVRPGKAGNYYALVTSGMSDRPMTTPENLNDRRFAELVIFLPPHWPMDTATWTDERNYWPVRLLKHLARFPHLYQTWFGTGHTIPNGSPPAAFAENTALCGAALLPSMLLPPEFSKYVVSPNRTIHFHTIVPLHGDEMDLKLNKGLEALLERLDKKGVTDVINPARASVAG